MAEKEILHRFGFATDEEPVSIYPFSPVFKVKGETNDFIIKRTQNQERKVMDYVTMLRDNGVNVVTPVPLKAENPQLIGNETYVTYPFIDGTSYTGKDQEIIEAGRLLGEIHYLSPLENTYNLDTYDVFDFNEEEVEESVQKIKTYAAGFNVSIDILQLEAKLMEAVKTQEILKNCRLPLVATPHDYKANNLIYTPMPFLIDPDNAAWVPRIFDLALALLLFHNEMATAPDRVFTTTEWQTFLSGYIENVSISEPELSNWQSAVEHVFLDEVMWLMAEVEEDWSNPKQRNLFVSLTQFILNSSSYSLD
ncbi:phosphotransferase [Oceanobacillus chungangensis]|uniref:Serine kinase n=1 Tax=Oceanobacillus chungangensis TaxID=1229152 RepID=A0A3D8PVI7_9BACI|nr:phosphotransferase [Oceanobacillus chungangensis]RDW19752.1 serine kinase [Oceanobacillus chungangensis]